METITFGAKQALGMSQVELWFPSYFTSFISLWIQTSSHSTYVAGAFDVTGTLLNTR